MLFFQSSANVTFSITLFFIKHENKSFPEDYLACLGLLNCWIYALSSFLCQVLSFSKVRWSLLPFEIPYGINPLWFMLNRDSANTWQMPRDLCFSLLCVTSRIMPCFFHFTLAWVLWILKTQLKKVLALSGNLTHALHQSELISPSSETLSHLVFKPCHQFSCTACVATYLVMWT